MTLPITSKTTLKDISSCFSEQFPYLKLLFFVPPSSENLYKSHPPDEERLVREFMKTRRNIFFRIHSWEKTKEVEMKFVNKIKIRTEILRRYKDRWIVTLGSDDLTLAEQNQLGKETAEIMEDNSSRLIQ